MWGLADETRNYRYDRELRIHYLFHDLSDRVSALVDRFIFDLFHEVGNTNRKVKKKESTI